MGPIYGCVMISIIPKYEKGKEKQSGSWYDHKRIEKISKKRVMELPSFVFGSEAGPADKAPR